MVKSKWQAWRRDEVGEVPLGLKAPILLADERVLDVKDTHLLDGAPDDAASVQLRAEIWRADGNPSTGHCPEHGDINFPGFPLIVGSLALAITVWEPKLVANDITTVRFTATLGRMRDGDDEE